MRKLLDLTYLFLKRNLTTTGLLSLLFPIVMIGFVALVSGDAPQPKTAVLLEDQGTIAAEIISGNSGYSGNSGSSGNSGNSGSAGNSGNSGNQTPQSADSADSAEGTQAAEGGKPVLHISKDREEAFARLEDGADDDLYILGPDFSAKIAAGEAPEVSHVKLDNQASGDLQFALYLQYKVNEALTASQLQAAGVAVPTSYGYWSINKPVEPVSSKEMTVVILVAFSVLYGSAFMGTDLVNQRKNKVLRRGLATPTSGRSVLGANLLGSWLLQYLTSVLTLLIISIFTPFSARNIGIYLLMFALLCFYSICIQILYLRIFKNPQLSAFFGMMIAVFLMFLAMLEDMKDLLSDVPDLLFKAAYLSPFYWILQAFQTGNLLLPAAILFLLGAACFFAGSFQVREFAD